MVIDLGDEFGTGHRAAAWSLPGCAVWSCSCGDGDTAPTPDAALAAASLHQVGATLVPA